jgi:di/tricarboxylate transporter
MEAATTRARGAGASVDRTEGRGVVRRLSTETKQAFKTTEFWAMVAVIVGILAAAAMIKGGDTAPGTDEFIAKQAWLYVAIVAVGYMISRGLAKSGSREPYEADRDDRDSTRG